MEKEYYKFFKLVGNSKEAGLSHTFERKHIAGMEPVISLEE